MLPTLSPPAPWHFVDGERPSLGQCLTLALLVHLLLVLSLGNTPGGNAAPGQGVWGALNIRLSGPDPAGQPDNTVPSDANSGPAGSATERRYGGAVRAPDDLPRPEQAPGAARQGAWQPRTNDASDSADGAAAVPPATPLPAAPLLPPPDSVPVPVPVPRPTPPVPTPAPSPAPTPVAPPAAAATTVAAPVVLPVPVPVPVVDPHPVATAALRPDPIPAPSPVPAPPVSTPTPTLPALPEPPVQRVLPAAPRLQPIQPAPASTIQPSAAERPALPTFETQPAPAPAPAPAPNNTAAGAAAPTAAAPGPDRPRESAGASTTASGKTPAPGAGAPDAGPRVGHDVATAPSLPASAPRLNLDLVRPRGAISARGGNGLLQLLPHPPESPSKLADDIAKSARPDCRQAYSGAGLLAVAPLALDALRDKGCRW